LGVGGRWSRRNWKTGDPVRVEDVPRKSFTTSIDPKADEPTP